MKYNIFKNKEKTKNKQEKSTGRSMVEMLGVLAIIGVLSIGGITGYTSAMRRYRANEILNVANKYAFLLYAKCQNAMMNDSSRYYIQNRTWYCPSYTHFTNTGLGGLPSGVDDILINKLNAPASTYESFPGLYIASTQSGDYVGLRINFASTEKELCKTALSIVGKQSHDPENCTAHNSSIVLVYTVPVN